jgi:hypothetical protein
MYPLVGSGGFEWSLEERDLTLSLDVRVVVKARAERLSAERFREGFCMSPVEKRVLLQTPSFFRLPSLFNFCISTWVEEF